MIVAVIVGAVAVSGQGLSSLGQPLATDSAGALVEPPRAFVGDERELCGLHGLHTDDGV